MLVSIRPAAAQAKQRPEPAPAPATAPLIDNPFAPEIFASAVSGFSFINGVVMIALESTRCDHSRNPVGVERVVVGRSVLTVPAAQALVMGLNQFLEDQGLSPSRAFAGDATKQ